MNHDEAVQQNATERYLLDELDPAVRDQFEEHLFDCQDCAIDVRAAAMFVEQTKVVLSEVPAASPARVPAQVAARPGFLAWLRPAFAVPVFALLLAVVGYQNLVQVPHLEQAANEPLVLSSASINVSTRAAVVSTQVTAKADDGFLLNVIIPPDPTYSTYTLKLHKPAGGLQYTIKIPASSPDDTHPVYFRGPGLEQGTYTLAVNGIMPNGQVSSLGSFPIEVQIQK